MFHFEAVQVAEVTAAAAAEQSDHWPIDFQVLFFKNNE